MGRGGGTGGGSRGGGSTGGGSRGFSSHSPSSGSSSGGRGGGRPSAPTPSRRPSAPTPPRHAAPPPRHAAPPPPPPRRHAAPPPPPPPRRHAAPPPPPPPRVNYGPSGGYGYGGARRNSGCCSGPLIIIAVIIVVVVLIAAVSGINDYTEEYDEPYAAEPNYAEPNVSGKNNTGTTIAREKLTADACIQMDQIIDDELGWLSDTEYVESEMNYFYNKTGVQPYLIICDNLDGIGEDITDEEAETILDSYYNDLFADEGHMIFVFMEYATSEYITFLYTGSDADTVIDADAREIFFQTADQFYTDSSLSDDEYFAKIFRYSANQIMN